MRYGMINLGALLIISILCINANAGDSCGELLKYGIYDSTFVNNESSRASTYKQAFCDQKFSSDQEARSFGINATIPIDSVPIKLGFDTSKQNWNEWYTSFCSDTVSSNSSNDKLRSLVKTVSSTLVDAFTQCINTDGFHVWLQRTEDPNKFYFVTKFQSPTSQVRKVNFKVTPPSNASCGTLPSSLKDNEMETTICTRSNNLPVVMAIAKSDYKPFPTGQIELPGIWKPIIKSPHKIFIEVASDGKGDAQGRYLFPKDRNRFYDIGEFGSEVLSVNWIPTSRAMPISGDPAYVGHIDPAIGYKNRVTLYGALLDNIDPIKGYLEITFRP